MAHHGPTIEYQSQYFTWFESGGFSFTPSCVMAFSRAACRSVSAGVVGSWPLNSAYASLISFTAVASIAISPACAFPSGTRADRSVLNVLVPIQPVSSMSCCRCTPAIPVSPTFPEIPWANPLLYDWSNSCHNQRPSRLTVRLYASTSLPGLDGCFPYSTASGGYRGRGNPSTWTMGPPL